MMKSGRKRVTPVIETAHPIVAFLFAYIDEHQIRLAHLAEAVHMRTQTISSWPKAKLGPRIHNLEQALNKIGYTLTVAKKDDGQNP